LAYCWHSRCPERRNIQNILHLTFTRHPSPR
jgi:hypothetical protein